MSKSWDTRRANGWKPSIESKLKMSKAAKARTLSDYPVVRFWKQVDKTARGCWWWTGAKDGDGYGMISVDKVYVKTHRYSYTLHIGDIPNDMLILHTCDNPSCVKPDHLFVGTHDDNMADMTSKDRSLKGMKNPQVKLTDKQVIRALKWKPGKGKLRELAAEFRVSLVTLEAIRSGRTWKHLYHHHSKFQRKP